MKSGGQERCPHSVQNAQSATPSHIKVGEPCRRRYCQGYKIYNSLLYLNIKIPLITQIFTQVFSVWQCNTSRDNYRLVPRHGELLYKTPSNAKRSRSILTNRLILTIVHFHILLILENFHLELYRSVRHFVFGPLKISKKPLHVYNSK